MKHKHQHIWLAVRTILTGSLIMHYRCQCGETVSVAEYKKLAAEDQEPIGVVANKGAENKDR